MRGSTCEDYRIKKGFYIYALGTRTVVPTVATVGLIFICFIKILRKHVQVHLHLCIKTCIKNRIDKMNYRVRFGSI
jgi:hypothetical protein